MQPNQRDVLLAYESLAKLAKARIDAAEQVKKAFPPGSRVEWKTYRRGESYEQQGKVVSSGSSYDPSRLGVKNDRTGKVSEIGISKCYGFSAADLPA